MILRIFLIFLIICIAVFAFILYQGCRTHIVYFENKTDEVVNIVLSVDQHRDEIVYRSSLAPHEDREVPIIFLYEGSYFIEVHFQESGKSLEESIGYVTRYDGWAQVFVIHEDDVESPVKYFFGDHEIWSGVMHGLYLLRNEASCYFEK